MDPETDFSSEVRRIWGDMPINSQEEVARALLTACADETLHGKHQGWQGDIGVH